MARLAEMTLEQWIGLIGLIVFSSVFVVSMTMRQKPPGGPK
jgi:hypothetical protein